MSENNNKVIRDKYGRYVKGTPSPNPTGKPKGLAKLSREMLDRIDPETGRSYLELMIEKYIQDAIHKGFAKSGAMVWERAYGKTPDKVIIQETDNLLSDDELLDMFDEEDFEKYEAKLNEVRDNEESSTDGDIAS